MSVWDDAAPTYRRPHSNYPTLLYSWWCTGFAAVIIITRVLGRKVRSNVLFREDWIILLALIPLLVRMAAVHVILLYDTNNIQTQGISFTEEELYHRSIGSKLVLISRIAYAAFIWTCKVTISEFLKRITARVWRKSYETVLRTIRAFLLLTFIAVVIATLAECQPFEDYWQVIPDPGPLCRQGYAQYEPNPADGSWTRVSMMKNTMLDARPTLSWYTLTRTLTFVTDLVLLVIFPVPLVLSSGQTWKRKLQLASLFSLSSIMIGITATRIPKVIEHRGRQQYRTVWASSEILAAAGVSSAVILGSFLKDKGTKRNKFRSSGTGTINSADQASFRRPTMGSSREFGSEEDLFRSLGMRVPDHLRSEPDSTPRPAPAAAPAPFSSRIKPRRMPSLPPMARGPEAAEETEAASSFQHRHTRSSLSRQSMSLFDVGGLLEDGKTSSDSRSHSTTTMLESTTSGTIAQDFASSSSSTEHSRKGSHAFLSDIGGIPVPSPWPAHLYSFSRPPERRDAPIGVAVPMLKRTPTRHHSLRDPGGLLREEEAESSHAVSRLAPPAPATRGGGGGRCSLQDVGGLLSGP
ncbi:integral membrane protein [Teratosphaeria destructans]|uniref:Integral membrane protein n=1 Tax=Teratosphaeria destructans TaxID=418781 RepID=A0A9W7W432_9PEZI|nr:integral membrane protein [Teratosphaeria destructans]